MPFSNESVLMLRCYSTEMTLSATSLSTHMKPISLFQDETCCMANTSWDGEKLSVLPSGDFEWQSPDVSMAGKRHLGNYSFTSNCSSVAMDTSFTGWVSRATNSCSSKNVNEGSVIKSSIIYPETNSPVCGGPIEASTPAGCPLVPVGRRESITDGEFIDNLEEVFMDEKTNAMFNDGRPESDFSCLVKAPIINIGPGTKCRMECSEKENLAHFGQNTARRNIFATVSSPASFSFRSRTSSSGLLDSPTCSQLQPKARGDRKLRRLSSAIELHQQQQPKQRGTTLTKFPSESEATSAARCLDLLTDGDLYNDEGRHFDLIGDFSRSHCLPLVTGGKHQDLKTISCHTMARILNHEFDDVIAQCTVVDCRYPYEFRGGHITGAQNFYSKDHVNQEFILSNPDDSSAENELCNKRNIIIFHCEFSSERGPRLLRFLRNKDRDLNVDSYPKLRHPEVYLLGGGYREFQEHYGELCTPVGGYVPMVDQDFANELIFYRQASKLYSGGVVERRKSSSTTRGRYCRM